MSATLFRVACGGLSAMILSAFIAWLSGGCLNWVQLLAVALILVGLMLLLGDAFL